MKFARGKSTVISAIGLLALLFSGFSSANPCALSHFTPYEEGIGGTGKQPVRQEGIGGTGHSEGVGGTGAPVITRKMTVVGVITGFASVCINGLEIHFDDSTKVFVDDKTTDLGVLKVGQIAQVETAERQGRLTAKALQIHHEVIGPVENIDVTAGVAQVVGQRIQISNDSAGDDLNTLSPGDNVKVSGFKVGPDEILVTRIEQADADVAVHLRSPETGDLSGKLASLQGVVEQVDESGVRLVGWPTIAISEQVPKPDIGDIVHLVIDNLSDKHPDIIEIEKIELDEIHARAGNLEIEVDSIEHYEHETDEDSEETEAEDMEPHTDELDEQDELETHDEEVELEDTSEYEPSEYESPEVPESPEYEAPEYEAPELPETPEYEAPEYEVPELPETPEYETPELPEVPEYEEPELPEVPEYEAPELPEPPELPEVDEP